ncbi:APC family permease [Sphingobium boeckii]|nr:APC family permease [Sphingobium boeckii]
MKMIGCLMITVSCVTPASSVFIVIPGVVQQAGSGALICALIGGLISLLIAYVYAELGSAFPLSGGEYAMVARAMGPLPGFIILGLNLVVLMLGIAVIALGLGTYVQALLPNTSALADALVCLALTTFCALLSVQTNALITGLFLALELIALVVVAALGFLEPVNTWASLITNPMVANAAGQIAPATLNNIGLGTSAAIFAFYGFGSAVYLGEETQGASRHIARAVLWALAISVVSQSVPLAALLLGAPATAEAFTSGTMFGDFVLARGGPGLAMAMNLAVALAIINANIAIVILAARMVFSTGRDQVWSGPINRALVRIDARYKTPWVATLVTGGLAGLLCLFDFSLLLIASGTALMVVYGFLCAAVIVGRRNGATAHAVYRMPFFPWPPVLALIAFAYVIYTNVTDPGTGVVSFLATTIVLAASATYYQFVLKRRGAWVLRGPEGNAS